MKIKIRIPAMIATFILLSGCALRPQKINPGDIYSYEESNYPSSAWDYVGSRGRWHYFDHPEAWYYSLDYKLNKKYLPGIEGFSYSTETDRPSLSTDVEVHREFIRVHIDGMPPVSIPFPSKGFVTADRRTKDRAIRVISGDRDITNDVLDVARDGGELTAEDVKITTGSAPPIPPPPPPQEVESGR